MIMEIIKNYNENEQEIFEDPLATLWGIYNTEIAPTGRIDSEHSAFKNIEARLMSKEISKENAIKEAWAVVNGRLEYN